MTPLYQLGDDLAFERCLPSTLKEEGGYSNDAHDPGGMTMEGITQREYDAWCRKNNLQTRWVKNISQNEVRTIYHDEYWLPHCQLLPSGLDLCLFDTNVNNGVHAGMVILQHALLVNPDGVWGPQTAAAANSLRGTARSLLLSRTIQNFYRLRAVYYQSLRMFPYFGKAWMRRDLDIEKWALAMVQT